MNIYSAHCEPGTVVRILPAYGISTKSLWIILLALFCI